MVVLEQEKSYMIQLERHLVVEQEVGLQEVDLELEKSYMILEEHFEIEQEVVP